MKYRVFTSDGFILHEGNNRRAADASAKQQSARLQERIIVGRWSADDEGYKQIATYSDGLLCVYEGV